MGTNFKYVGGMDFAILLLKIEARSGRGHGVYIGSNDQAVACVFCYGLLVSTYLLNC